MKVCPLCSESFGNELNFCDVDGAKLKRQQDASGAGEQSKLWQLLGVGLLLGALVLSAASIFLPKARVTPANAISSTPTDPASNRSVANDSAIKPAPSAAVSDETPVNTDELALAETKRKDKALALAAQNSSTPGPNPKAAALAAEEGDKGPPTDQAPKIQPPLPAAPEGAASVKSVSETREPAAPPKAAPAVAESKEPRKQPAETKSPAKDSNGKKKTDDKEKEKKGGFLRVFKKIFGKD